MIDSSTQVRVRFVTANEQHRVSDAPFVVPAKLGHSGLNEVLNHLLENEEDKIKFDFQIGEYLLRVPLYKFIHAHRLNTEDTITIHYFLAVSTEISGESEELPAWIASIDTSFSPTQSISGCYDGSLRLFDSSSLQIIQEIAAHDEPITSVKSWKDETFGNVIGTASKDNSVKLWSYKNSSAQLIATLEGHINSVESLHHWTNQSAASILSGDWSGHLHAWKMPSLSDQSGEPAVDDKKKSKKRKTGKQTEVEVSSAQTIKSLFSIKAHSQSITGIHTDGSKGYTSSWDHSIKVWDLERQDNVFTINASKVVTSMSHREESGAYLIATSHPDGRVRIWDERRKESTGATHHLGMNSTWISQVSSRSQLFPLINLRIFNCLPCVVVHDR